MRESYKNIENKFKQDTLIISLWSSTIVHILYLLMYLFLFNKEYNPIVYSLSISLLLHVCFFYWINKGYFSFVTYVFILEIEILLVFLSFFVLGKETGVHYILLIFSMLSFSVNNEKKIKFSNLLFLINIVLFLGVEMEFIPIKVIVQFPESVIPYIKTSCILVTLVLIYYLSVYFRKTRIKKEEQLEKKQKEIHLQSEQLQELNSKLKSNLEFIEVQNRKLEQANSTKNRLFSIISHDLINPLSSLSAFTDLLKDSIDFNDKEPLSKIALGIYDSVSSLNVLTQNLLNWSRTQMDSIKPSFFRFELFKVVNNNIQLFHSNLQSKNITLNCKVSEDSNHAG